MRKGEESDYFASGVQDVCLILQALAALGMSQVPLFHIHQVESLLQGLRRALDPSTMQRGYD